MSRISHGFPIVPVLKLLLALSAALASTYVASGRLMFVAAGAPQPQQDISTRKIPAEAPTLATKGTSRKQTNRSVALAADKRQVEVNEPVQFTVTIKGYGGVVQGGCRFSYLLFFGDGRSQTALMTCDRNKKFQHTYGRNGRYVAHVENFTTDCYGVVTAADPVTVIVGATPTPTPFQSRSPNRRDTPTPEIGLTPTPDKSSSPNRRDTPTPEIGLTPTPDKSSSPNHRDTPTPEISLTPTPNRSSSPHRTDTRGPNGPTTLSSPSPKPADTSSLPLVPIAGVSPSQSPTPTGVSSSSPGQPGGERAGGVTPVPSPSDTPIAGGSDLAQNWWKYLLVILVVILASFAGYRALRRTTRPRLTIGSHLDPGVSSFVAKSGSKNFAINVAIVLNARISNSQSHISTSEANLIRSERREDG